MWTKTLTNRLNKLGTLVIFIITVTVNKKRTKCIQPSEVVINFFLVSKYGMFPCKVDEDGCMDGWMEGWVDGCFSTSGVHHSFLLFITI